MDHYNKLKQFSMQIQTHSCLTELIKSLYVASICFCAITALSRCRKLENSTVNNLGYSNGKQTIGCN